MKITWHGHACFSITHDGYTVVIDPYNADYTAGYPKLHLKADKAAHQPRALRPQLPRGRHPVGAPGIGLPV